MDMEQGIINACSRRSEGVYDQALDFFNRIVADGRYRERALLEVGKTYKMMNLPDQAIDAFAALVREFPGNAEGMTELGQTARLSCRYDVAVEVLEAMAGTGNWIACLELSKIRYAQDDLESSMGNLMKVESLHPGHSEVKLGCGRIYKKQGAFQKAEHEFCAVLASDPAHFDACYEMGDLCHLTRNYAKAIEYFERIAGRAGDKQLYLRLVELHHLNNDAIKSEAAADKVLSLTPGAVFDRDVILNEIEVLQRKTVLKSRVKRLWVTVTSRCNIRCKTCGLWHSTWDLPYKTAKEVMSYYPYLERLVWLGGEVFLYKHFEEMFDEAAKYPQLRQQVITNGYILNEKWIDRIVRSGNTELTFSIDGTTKEVYESIRQGSDFEKVLQNVRRVMAAKRACNSRMDVRLNAVIMRSNCHQIEDFIELARNEGFNQVSLMALHFDLAPEENIFYGNRDDVMARSVGAAIPHLREKAKRYGLDLDILLPPGVDFEDLAAQKSTTRAAQPQGQATPGRGNDLAIPCKMPWGYMMMCDKGDVYLTGSCVKSIGNIYQNSLDEIWNSEIAQQYRKKMIEHRFEEYCRTECISRWKL